VGRCPGLQCYQVRRLRNAAFHYIRRVHRNDGPIYIFSSFFFGGLAYSWGMVQARLTEAKLASDAQLSFIGSTAIAFISVAALINVRLIRWLGTRKACVLGCFFLGLGPLLNGFATRSYGGLFVTNGLVLGFGTSLTFMVSISFSHGILRRLSHDHLTGQRSLPYRLAALFLLNISGVDVVLRMAWFSPGMDSAEASSRSH